MPDRVEQNAVRERPGTQAGAGTRARTALGAAIGLVSTPLAIGIAANGAVTTGRWWDPTDRWLAPTQSAVGAALLLLVAVLALVAPTAVMTAGLVWGVLPGIAQVVFPERTYRWIAEIPGLPTELDRALHTWLAGGVVLMIGVLLFGAGLTATLHRRRVTVTALRTDAETAEPVDRGEHATVR